MGLEHWTLHSSNKRAGQLSYGGILISTSNCYRVHRAYSHVNHACPCMSQNVIYDTVALSKFHIQNFLVIKGLKRFEKLDSATC